MSTTKTAIIEEIIQQHFDEASFLWSQRDVAVTSPNYSLQDLVYLDQRVEAHIDGLRVAGDYGWALCETGVLEDEPGTVFTATVIAFESGEEEKMDLVMGVGSKSRVAFRAMVSGLGWMKDKRFNSIIKGLVSNDSRRYRRLGIASCGIRRLDPRIYLDQALNSSDLFLRTLALRTAGELKRRDLLPLIQRDLQQEDHRCRFEAARSALLLGDRSALEVLIQFTRTQSPFQIPAMQTAFRLIDLQAAQNLLRSIAKDRKQIRAALIGISIVGDPMLITMLIQHMETPELARVAGEAFTSITGAELAETNLEGTRPDGFDAGPNDDAEDENVEMDMDEDLPWPGVTQIKHWWKQNNGNFSPGKRYLAGSPISPQQCSDMLENGNQRQRHAAARELALGQADADYPNIKAPGHWQSKSF